MPGIIRVSGCPRIPVIFWAAPTGGPVTPHHVNPVGGRCRFMVPGLVNHHYPVNTCHRPGGDPGWVAAAHPAAGCARGSGRRP